MRQENLPHPVRDTHSLDMFRDSANNPEHNTDKVHKEIVMRSLTWGVFLVLVWVGSVRAENWPGWRGPRGDGTSAEKEVPTTWSPAENVRWKVKLPGPGNSSPIVWGNRVFLTQAFDRKGTERAVLCFDRVGSKLVWQKSIAYKGDEPTHGTNPYCSSTPVTDGERVIASHGSAGVVCYDFEGKLLWQRDLGAFIHIWGTAASPILHDDLVILNCGPGERTFLLAMNKKTGKDVWKVEEPGGKSGEKGDNDWIGSWSTPRVVKVQGRDQLVMSWPNAVKAYDPNTGKLIWTCGGLTRLVYTSPLVTPEFVVTMSGFHGSALAVKAGGKGDVTRTHRLWHHTDKNPQRIGSGIILGDYLYMANAGPGTVQCIELKTGKDRWEGKRLGADFWASLVLADGKFYATDQEGDTYVFAAKPDFEQISRNRLDEHTNASLAISEGDILIRTHEHLWCIGNNRK
jgi:outer membrane protein assembly factor BamB